MQALVESSRPESDSDTTALREAAASMAERARALQIVDDATLTDANALGSDVASTLRSVEKRRKFFVEPLNNHVKTINELFRKMCEPLKSADEQLRRKILAFRAAEQERIDDARREAEAKAREEARKAQEKAAAAEAARIAGDNRKAAQLERAAEKAQSVAESTATTAAVLLGAGPAKSMDAGDGAKNKTSRVWRFEVVDAAQVPRQFLAVDEKSIRAAVAQGAREIPGVRIFETEQLAFASRR